MSGVADKKRHDRRVSTHFGKNACRLCYLILPQFRNSTCNFLFFSFVWRTKEMKFRIRGLILVALAAIVVALVNADADILRRNARLVSRVSEAKTGPSELKKRVVASASRSIRVRDVTSRRLSETQSRRQSSIDRDDATLVGRRSPSAALNRRVVRVNIPDSRIRVGGVDRRAVLATNRRISNQRRDALGIRRGPPQEKLLTRTDRRAVSSTRRDTVSTRVSVTSRRADLQRRSTSETRGGRYHRLSTTARSAIEGRAVIVSRSQSRALQRRSLSTVRRGGLHGRTNERSRSTLNRRSVKLSRRDTRDVRSVSAVRRDLTDRRAVSSIRRDSNQRRLAVSVVRRDIRETNARSASVGRIAPGSRSVDNRRLSSTRSGVAQNSLVVRSDRLNRREVGVVRRSSMERRAINSRSPTQTRRLSTSRLTDDVRQSTLARRTTPERRLVGNTWRRVNAERVTRSAARVSSPERMVANVRRSDTARRVARSDSQRAAPLQPRMSRIAASGERRSSSLHQRAPANRRAVAMARSMHERSELSRIGHRRNSVDNRIRNLSSQRHRVTSVRDSVKARSPMMARSSDNQSGARRSVSHIRRTIRDGQRRAVISRQRLGQRRTIAGEMRRSALERRSALNRRNADTTRRATAVTRQASRSQVDRRSVQRVRSNVERRMLDVSRTRLGNTRIRTTTRRSAVERRARYDHRRLPLRSDLNRGMVASNREIRERRSVQINRRSLRDRRVAPTSNARRVVVGSATGGLIRDAVRTYSLRRDLTRRNSEPVRRVAEWRARALTRRVTSNTRRVAVNSEPAVARRTTVGYRRDASMGRRLAPISQRHAVRAVVQLHKAGESSGVTIVLSLEEPDVTTSNTTATTIKDSNAESEFVPQEKVMLADEDVGVAVSEKNTYQFVEGSTLQSTGVFVTSNFTELDFSGPVFVKANHTAWENEPLRIDRFLATAMPASVI